MRSRDEVKAAEAVVEGFFEAMDRQDLGWMQRHVATDPEMVNIGTEADEFWVGGDVIHADTERMFESMTGYHARLRDRHLRLSASGEVAWFAHRMDARIEYDDRFVELRDARFSGVMERRDDVWVLVQTHVSIPEDQTDG